LELQENEAAFSICTVNFHDKEYGTLLAVGTAKGLQFTPKWSLTAGFIHRYRFLDDGRSLELLHKTQVEALRVFLLLYVSFKEDYLQELDLCSGYMIWEKDDY